MAQGTTITFGDMAGGPPLTKNPDDVAATIHPSRFARFVAARLDPKAYLGLHVTVSLTIAALALWLFGAVLEEVLDNATVVRPRRGDARLDGDSHERHWSSRLLVRYPPRRCRDDADCRGGCVGCYGTNGIDSCSSAGCRRSSAAFSSTVCSSC